ncbi:MAG: hypothetical protein NXI22_17325, partial [bacterium]|nr:hypothetical protein [bacterium]
LGSQCGLFAQQNRGREPTRKAEAKIDFRPWFAQPTTLSTVEIEAKIQPVESPGIIRLAISLS